MQQLEVMHEAQPVQKVRRHRNGAVNALAALFQALEDEDAVAGIDAVGGQRQRFGDPAAGMGQRSAEGSDLV